MIVITELLVGLSLEKIFLRNKRDFSFLKHFIINSYFHYKKILKN